MIKTYRNHYSFIIELMLKSIWILVGVLIYVSDFISTSFLFKYKFYSSLIILAVIAIYLFLIINRWYKTTITLDEDLIIYRRNTIFKKELVLSKGKISTVDFSQKISNRLFGTFRIKIDTNSVTSNTETNLEIVLKKDESILFKEIVLGYQQPTDNKEHCYLVNLDSLIKYYITNEINLIKLSYVVGAALFFTEFLNRTFKILSNYINYNYLFVIMLILTLIGQLIINFIKIYNKYYNYTVDKIEDKIVITHGLITTNRYTIPINKISSITIIQTLVGRIFKAYTIKISVIGYGNEENEVSILYPIIKDNEVNYYIKLINDKYEHTTIQRHLSKRRVLSAFLKPSILIIMFFFFKLLNIFESYIVLWIILLYLSGNIISLLNSRLAINDDFIKIRKGIFKTYEHHINTYNVEIVTIKQGLIQRLLKLYKFTFSYYGPITNNSASITNMDRRSLVDIKQYLVN